VKTKFIKAISYSLWKFFLCTLWQSYHT